MHLVGPINFIQIPAQNVGYLAGEAASHAACVNPHAGQLLAPAMIPSLGRQQFPPDRIEMPIRRESTPYRRKV